MGDSKIRYIALHCIEARVKLEHLTWLSTSVEMTAAEKEEEEEEGASIKATKGMYPVIILYPAVTIVLC